MTMRRLIIFVFAFLFSGIPGFASSIGTAARTVIPKDVQQIINVDYRRMKSSDTAMAKIDKLMPPNLKQLEDALKDIAEVHVSDLEQISLASNRIKVRHNLQISGIALAHLQLHKL